jgi:diguanylate cyclase (GGDEF)-like protein
MSKNEFDEFSKELIAMAQSGGLTLGDVDIDQFESINTRYGRAGGDRVLAHVEQLLKSCLPEGFFVRRFGDEFYVYSSNCSLEAMFMELEEVRAKIAAHKVPYDGHEIEVQVSGSVGEFGRTADNVVKLLNLCSEGLMLAKNQGRNRMVFAPGSREQKMVLKSSYYLSSQLEGLSKLSAKTQKSESALLREAIDDLLRKYGL